MKTKLDYALSVLKLKKEHLEFNKQCIIEYSGIPATGQLANLQLMIDSLDLAMEHINFQIDCIKQNTAEEERIKQELENDRQVAMDN